MQRSNDVRGLRGRLRREESFEGESGWAAERWLCPHRADAKKINNIYSKKMIGMREKWEGERNLSACDRYYRNTHVIVTS